MRLKVRLVGVPPWVAPNRVSPWAMALMVAATYLFDVVESDFRLQFKKRGRPVARVINEDDLVPVGERETFVEERAQDVELPLRFSVVYRDVERDGDPGVQSVQRVSNPDATMRSRNEASLELPLALTPKEAKGIAQSLMFSAWIERTGQQLATTWTHIDLDPADVIQLLRKSGELMTLRVNRLEIGGNLEIRLETVVEEASSYTSFAETDGGRLFRRFELPGSVESRLVLLDMPLIDDERDNGRKSLQPYWAAGGLGLGRWPGGSLYVSEDGVAFAFVDEALTGVSWGILLAEVGDVALPFQTDDVNTIQVFMTEGSLASVSEPEMLQAPIARRWSRRTARSRSSTSGTRWRIPTSPDATRSRTSCVGAGAPTPLPRSMCPAACSSRSRTRRSTYRAALGIERHVSGIADPFNGYIDEFRIAHVQRSDGWIETTWNNMSDPGTFAVAGVEEQEGGEPPPLAGAGVVVCLMG